MRAQLAALALAAGLLLGAPAATAGVLNANPMTAYATNPVEHDDQGAVRERDNLATSVLGPLVVNRVLDPSGTGLGAVRDPWPTPLHDGPIAPGCTGDAGPRPAGTCGLWTTGAGTPFTGRLLRPFQVPPPVSEDGLCQAPGPIGAPPGAYSGGCGALLRGVRFLDATARPCLPAGGAAQVEAHRKVAATPLGGTVLGQAFLAGPTCITAWYGTWWDRNGNGVLDHAADFHEHELEEPGTAVPEHEEFAWLGNCHDFDGIPQPAAVRIGYCARDVEAAAGGTTRMVGFLYPGNHHASCGAVLDPLLASCAAPADLPGRQVVQLLAGGGLPLCRAPLDLGCVPGADLDTADEAAFGDPLLGPQDSVAYDQEYRDGTGDHRLAQRTWALGTGFPLWVYDQSVLATTVHVTAVGCAPGGIHGVRLGTCRFVDVDRYHAWNALAEAALQGTAKPLARSAWVLARAEGSVLLAGADRIAGGSATDASPVLGPLDDQLLHPGFAREPNEPGDRFPAAVHGAGPDPGAQHRGWYNDYAAHREGPRAYADVVVQRVAWANRPVAFQGGCLVCTAGLFAEVPFAGEPAGGSVLREPGDHRRTLGPGAYAFDGVAGLWHDQPHAWTERFADPLCIAEPANALGTCSGATGLERAAPRAAGPDGWVGNIVAQTGTWRYRGYADEACTTDQGPGPKPYGACHPYMDGRLQNPQGYARGSPAHGEWEGRCDAVQGDLVLTPTDGAWDVPVLVWRHHLDGVDVAELAEGLEHVEDLTGTQGPILLGAACQTGAMAGGIAVVDLLILPLGNEGETFAARLAVRAGGEEVVDVDTYHGTGLLPA